MSGFMERRFCPFVFLAASFAVIPAVAQFEIAPDHFDGSDQKTSKPKAGAKPKPKTAHQAPGAAAHRASVPPIASAATKPKQSPRTQTQIARRSKADVELGSSHR